MEPNIKYRQADDSQIKFDIQLMQIIQIIQKNKKYKKIILQKIKYQCPKWHNMS